MRQRLKFSSLCVALVLTFAAAAPHRVCEASVGQAAASASAGARRSGTRDSSVESRARKRGDGGNAFVRVLTAPFRALARIFGGEKKQAGDAAQRPARKREQNTVRGAGAEANRSETGAAKETAAQAVEKQSDAAAGDAGERPVSVAGAVETRTAPGRPRQVVNIIRPDEGRAAPGEQTLPQLPGMWVPGVEGVPKDHLSQGRALLTRERLDEAVAELSIASTIGPDLVEANNLLGLAYDKKGWHAQAVECYERALALAPNDPQVLNNLGYSLYLGRQYEAALKRLKQAARYAPDAPSVLAHLGAVQASLGRYDEAFKNLVRAGGEYDARLRIAQMLEDAGRAREAVKHYEAALRLQPDSSAVLERLAELYERTGRTKEAEAARRTLGNPPNKQRTATGGGG